MNDGSIYNRAFNITFVLTLVLLLFSVCIGIYNVVMGSPIDLLLLVFNNIYRIIMVFLFVFFAYDSAKKQLNKVNFS
jgi:multisubunit Na+/H+ antiporter MnhF subunit